MGPQELEMIERFSAELTRLRAALKEKDQELARLRRTLAATVESNAGTDARAAHWERQYRLIEAEQESHGTPLVSAATGRVEAVSRPAAKAVSSPRVARPRSRK